MRFAAWRVTIGSAMPSSSTRLRSVVMFCSMATSAAALELLRRHAHLDVRAVCLFARSELQAAIRRLQRIQRGLQIRRVAQHDADYAGGRVRGDRPVGNARLAVAQLRAGIALHALHCLRQRALNVDLVYEVHAAAQIEAEAHGLEPDRAHPLRRARHAGESDQVVALGALDDRLLRVFALLLAREPHDQPVLLEVRDLRRELRSLEDTEHALLRSRVHRHAIVTRQLQRRALAEHVRQREQRAEDDDEDDEPILPAGEVIHAGSVRGSSACPWATPARPWRAGS